MTSKSLSLSLSLSLIGYWVCMFIVFREMCFWVCSEKWKCTILSGFIIFPQIFIYFFILLGKCILLDFLWFFSQNICFFFFKLITVGFIFEGIMRMRMRCGLWFNWWVIIFFPFFFFFFCFFSTHLLDLILICVCV